MNEQQLIDFKKEASEVLRLGKMFADATEKWQKNTAPIREELMKINSTDPFLVELSKDMDKLSDRLGM